MHILRSATVDPSQENNRPRKACLTIKPPQEISVTVKQTQSDGDDLRLESKKKHLIRAAYALSENGVLSLSRISSTTSGVKTPSAC
jgi:hypothetical protein